MTALMLVLSLAFSLPGSHQPLQPELWHGAHSGMTRWQILHLFSGAVAPALPDRDNGELEGVVMPAVVADHPAIVHFFFTGRGLSSVNLVFEPETGRLRANAAETHELADLISRQYGPPTRCEPAGPDIADRYRCRWDPGLIHIHLDYRDGEPPALNLVYRNDISETRRQP